MRTDADLRAACEELAHEVPDLVQIVARLPQPTRRRTWRRAAVPIVATVAIVAAVAVSVALLAGRSSSTPRPAAPTPAVRPTPDHPCASSGTPRFDTFAVDEVPGFASA